MYISILGFIGGGILSLNMIPQIYQIISTKKADDISTMMLVMNITGL